LDPAEPGDGVGRKGRGKRKKKSEGNLQVSKESSRVGGESGIPSALGSEHRIELWRWKQQAALTCAEQSEAGGTEAAGAEEGDGGGGVVGWDLSCVSSSPFFFIIPI